MFAYFCVDCKDGHIQLNCYKTESGRLKCLILCCMQRLTNTLKLLQNWNWSPEMPQFCVLCKDGRVQ